MRVFCARTGASLLRRMPNLARPHVGVAARRLHPRAWIDSSARQILQLIRTALPTPAAEAPLPRRAQECQAHASDHQSDNWRPGIGMNHRNHHAQRTGCGFPQPERLASLGTLAANPVGSYYTSPNAAVFWVNDALEGMTFWGKPGQVDIDMIEATLRFMPAPLRHGRASLIDLRRLESMDLRAFGKLSDILTSRVRASPRLITRQAVLEPEEPAGAIAVALFATLSPARPLRSFTEVREALEWIGVHDFALNAEFERLNRVSPASSPVIGTLRKYLERASGSTAMDAAAQIGVSQRTLQRRLRESGTSYQREASLARIEVAKRLLRTTESPIKCIALEAGYASPQHFSSSFRKHTQLSPSRWRAEHRK